MYVPWTCNSCRDTSSSTSSATNSAFSRTLPDLDDSSPRESNPTHVVATTRVLAQKNQALLGGFHNSSRNDAPLERSHDAHNPKQNCHKEQLGHTDAAQIHSRRRANRRPSPTRIPAGTRPTAVRDTVQPEESPASSALAEPAQLDEATAVLPPLPGTAVRPARHSGAPSRDEGIDVPRCARLRQAADCGGRRREGSQDQRTPAVPAEIPHAFIRPPASRRVSPQRSPEPDCRTESELPAAAKSTWSVWQRFPETDCRTESELLHKAECR